MRTYSRIIILITFCFLSLYWIFNVVNHDELDSATIQLYQNQVKDRKLSLEHVSHNSNFMILYNVLVPEVYCKDLVRIGQVIDGGKWVCNPLKIKNMEDCTIYSLGTNGDPSFEVNFQEFTNKKCKLRCADMYEQHYEVLGKIKNVNGKFKKAKITSNANNTKNEYTFQQFMDFFNDTKIDILKIDIEGSEFEIKNELISVPICQLLIEVHGKTALQTLKFLRKLSRHGFYLFSYEINGQVHELSEYSFIHENCLKDFGVKTILGKYLS